jgi:transposase-like protein
MTTTTAPFGRSARRSRPEDTSPTEEAARKLIYLSITDAQKSWRNTYNSSAALP